MQQPQQQQRQQEPKPKLGPCDDESASSRSSSLTSTTTTTITAASSSSSLRTVTSGGASSSSGVSPPAAARRAPPPSSSSSVAPYFYHTCPQYQAKDLERERNEVLSEQERDEADADLRGTSAIVREPSDVIKERILDFYDTLESIPADQKHSYVAAVEARSKEFVRKESPSPLAFLRCEQFDAIKAARRFVDYWSVRHQIFGDDRAFRCMCPKRTKKNALEEDVYDDGANDGGCADDNDPNDDDDEDGDDEDAGCMSIVDWEALHSGTAKELPHDAFGRAVVVFKANCVPAELADRQPIMVRTYARNVQCL
jgi:hypothetical protein